MKEWLALILEIFRGWKKLMADMRNKKISDAVDHAEKTEGDTSEIEDIINRRNPSDWN